MGVKLNSPASWLQKGSRGRGGGCPPGVMRILHPGRGAHREDEVEKREESGRNSHCGSGARVRVSPPSISRGCDGSVAGGRPEADGGWRGTAIDAVS